MTALTIKFGSPGTGRRRQLDPAATISGVGASNVGVAGSAAIAVVKGCSEAIIAAQGQPRSAATT